MRSEYGLTVADYGKTVEIDPKNVLAYRSRALSHDAKGEKELTAADRKKRTSSGANPNPKKTI